MEKHFFVYILANKTNTTIYTGVTSNLPVRIREHKDHMDPNSFTAKYDVTKLVNYEEAGREPLAAFERESRSKAGTGREKTSWSIPGIPTGRICIPGCLNNSRKGVRIAAPVCALARNDRGEFIPLAAGQYCREAIQEHP